MTTLSSKTYGHIQVDLVHDDLLRLYVTKYKNTRTSQEYSYLLKKESVARARFMDMCQVAKTLIADEEAKQVA